MRIAFISEHFYPSLGGIQEHLYFMIKELLSRGHQPTIITPRPLTLKKIEEWWPKDLPRECYRPLGVSVPYFANGSVSRMTVEIGMGRKLHNLLGPENFDITHIHAPLFGTLPALAIKFARTPLVGTWHTSFEGSKNFAFLKDLLQRHVDCLDAIIGVAPMAFTSMRNYFSFEGEIIPNGIDTQMFHPLDANRDDRLKEFVDDQINIFFIGRPDPRNGLDTLIHAFAQVHAKHPKTRLLIAGDGTQMPQYKRLVETLFSDSSVVFLGAVRDERPQLYRTAHIQVFNVERATCAITLLEGMASGIPVVSSDFKGHDFIGTDGKEFITTPFRNVPRLVTALNTLIENPKMRLEIANHARKRALSFDWKKVTDQIISVYERLLEKPSALASSANPKAQLTQVPRQEWR